MKKNKNIRSRTSLWGRNFLPWLIVICALIAFVAIVLFLLNYFKSEPELKAEISVHALNVGEPLTFKAQSSCASTGDNATTWLWEFGNGDRSTDCSGVYVYNAPGKYQIRFKTQERQQKFFLVEVKEQVDRQQDFLAGIEAPSKAFQGELVVFNGSGNDKQWRWEFGESGRVDSREKNPIYAYQQAGTYEVRLSTENTRYPIRHKIQVFPKYMETDTTDVLTLIGLDIKEKLQNIADGKPFNYNYNYILKEYLGQDAHIKVTINNTKFNDFYSYCQGLRHVGKNTTLIENVLVETKSPQSSVIDKIIVLQLEAEK